MIYKRLFSYLKDYKKEIVTVCISVIISSLFSLISPLLLGKIISSLYSSVSNSLEINSTYIYKLITIIGASYLIISLCSYIENLLMSNISEKASNKLKNDLNKKLSKLPMKYYDTHTIGELTYYINNDIDIISSLFLQTIPKTINYSISFIGILIVMLTINVPLSLIVLITLPLTILITKLLIKVSKKKHLEYHNKYTYLNSLTQESYSNIETFSLYNNKEQMIKSFSYLNKDLAKTNLKANMLATFSSPLISLINYMAYLIIIVLGSHYVLINKMLLGDIQSFIQYTKQISNPISNFSSLINSIQSGIVSSSRVFAMLDEKEEIQEGNMELKEIETIEFKNVSFSYNDSPLIENFNLKINKGEKVAIIGETGSGKSTIINLLMRFYKINRGEILINNVSIYDYNINSYYKNISLVPQEKWLFKGSIKDNLKYSDESINDEKVAEICNYTNFLNITNKFNNKLEESLEENDKRLSEGEKQLLAINRSLIKEHNLLILDEATSNVDSTTEQIMQKATNKLLENKTSIVVAHKLSTIQKADKIIVIKNGMIIEEGNHTTLFKEKGEYYKFIQTL